MKVIRPIYNQNYYKAQAMLRDPWFIEKIAWLKGRFAEVGCPLPESGFKEYSQYLDWREHYWKRYSEMITSQEFKEGCYQITGGQDQFPRETMDKLEEFERSFLPPVYGEYFNEILQHYEIDPNNKRFYDFIEFHVFLGVDSYTESTFLIRLAKNRKTHKSELFIQIYGYTKKEDIINNWPLISKEQACLPGFLGKSKKWETFERDLDLYNEYKKLKMIHKINKEGGFSLLNPRGLDVKLLLKLHKKYPELTITSIRTNIAKTKKRLGEK